MGDPECQTILPKLKTDLIEILLSCCDKKLDKLNIEWLNKKSLCIVVCSKGYPDIFQKNVEIENINKINLKRMNFISCWNNHGKQKNLCYWWKSIKFRFIIGRF